MNSAKVKELQIGKKNSIMLSEIKFQALYSSTFTSQNLDN